MNFVEFVHRRQKIAQIFGGAAVLLFGVGLWFSLPLKARLFLILVSFILFAFSFFWIVSARYWAKFLLNTSPREYVSFIISVPITTLLPCPGLDKGDLILFFKNASPDALTGTIELYIPRESPTPCATFKLRPPRSYVVNSKEYWPRSTGDIYPVETGFIASDVDCARGALKVDLSWTFENTYLESLIPKSKELELEVFLVGKRNVDR